ncbi:hypothetical protein RCL_jg23242.t1 [Rhizophagus clarus]|uniref:Uncharacterized protein n=1 Tax=Rhizophagus clarus TaxID=94130 RepID=A0A8H3L544_9GLOM|nr:hypothetical protein RCL_jg23242.t1 [Rhizophagus clarus]
MKTDPTDPQIFWLLHSKFYYIVSAYRLGAIIPANQTSKVACSFTSLPSPSTKATVSSFVVNVDSWSTFGIFGLELNTNRDSFYMLTKQDREVLEKIQIENARLRKQGELHETEGKAENQMRNISERIAKDQF